MTTRYDSDALGKVEVPKEALWSAQTQRSIENFPFGPTERQPVEIIKALATIKEASALANKDSGKLPANIADAIISAAKSVREGEHLESFPLVIWQTGSGTQSNMNMNEVIANLASVSLGGELGQKKPVHPNDHVNMGQSSNDVFPSAMHIAVSLSIVKHLKPALEELIKIFYTKSREYENIVKIGRTHMMDAVPMTLGQEFSAYSASLEMCLEHIINTESAYVRTLALGGTAVGTGLNSYVGFDVDVAKHVSSITGLPFVTSKNKFMALSVISPMVAVSGAVATLASTLLKIVNDIRLLSSGPRSGLGELILPSNEPGSSIMPGKVNPTQCESLSMVCTQVLGASTTILTCNLFGHLQLNVFLPVVASNLLRNVRLLSIAMTNFVERCLEGLKPNHATIEGFVAKSLMLVTALVPYVGYDMAARIALDAHGKGCTLKESAVELGAMTAEEFDERVKAEKMVRLE